MDIENVRKRPGMYVGDTNDGTGLRILLQEVILNALKEADWKIDLRVEVIWNDDGSYTVRDDGGGLPTEIWQGRPYVEHALTNLHTGMAAHRRNDWEIDLLGVDLCVVNALCEWIVLRIWGGGSEHRIACKYGVPETALVKTGATVRHGTEISLCPDRDIFGSAPVPLDTIAAWLRELKLPNVTLSVTLGSGQSGAMCLRWNQGQLR